MLTKTAMTFAALATLTFGAAAQDFTGDSYFDGSPELQIAIVHTDAGKYLQIQGEPGSQVVLIVGSRLTLPRDNPQGLALEPVPTVVPLQLEASGVAMMKLPEQNIMDSLSAFGRFSVQVVTVNEAGQLVFSNALELRPMDSAPARS